MWKLIVALVLAAGVAVGWLLWKQNRSEPLIVSGVVEADQIRVGSRVGGRVAEVMAVEGQRLARGAPLFRVEPYDFNEKLARAQAEVRALNAELRRFQAGFRTEEIAQARAHRDRLAAALAKAEAGPRQREIEIAEQKLKVAQANLELAEAEHKDIAALAPERDASRRELDQATRKLKASRAELAAAEQELLLLKEGTRQEDLADARAALAEAEAALKLVETGYRKEDVAAAEAKLAAAQAEAGVIQAQINELVVSAPLDCLVEAIDLRPGDIVPANAPAVSLLETSKLWIRAYVPEGQLAAARLGARVPVRLDSFPGQRFMGTITFIASEGEFTPRNVQTPEERSKQVFRIKLEIDDSAAAGGVRVGMLGDVLLAEAEGR
jgi:multidrug resistance efflux pump